MEGNSKAGEFDRKELFFLVAKFLEASPCQESAKVLKAELGLHKLLPKAKNWLGQERQLTYKEAENRNWHVESKHLELVCSKLLVLLQEHNYQKTSGLTSLLGAGATSCIHNEDNTDKKFSFCSALHVSQRTKELFLNFRQQPTANLCNLVGARQISPCFNSEVFRSPFLYEQLHKQYMVLGHLAAVFCVLFDHTGRCIITGADDDLLKVWSSRTGQLLATLRGHSAEVTDISLSCDNTMIASGSLDKSVRVWCAQSSTPIAVLTGHQSHVTSVQFSPSANEEFRYLASTGKDGYLCFWQWLPDRETYSSSPIKFMEKNRMGDQTLCSAFSSGGKYFVTGGTDHLLRVYVCIPGPPVLYTELDGHKDRIMSVQFGNTEGVLATGSCDATARIWRFQEKGWTSITLEVTPQEMKNFLHNNEKPQVTMVGWEKTDCYLTTAFTPDCIIRVWDSVTGQLVQKLKGHTGEVFVLEAHPIDPRILLTAGHDGLLMVWDMLAGICLKTVKFEGEDGFPASIFDCKFSPDGLMCAAVDVNGHLSLLGFGSNDDYKHPREQFFHTDYRPLMRDSHHYVIDEQSQLPPHLLPPPYLVDIDGHAHPIQHQESILRLVRPVEQVRSNQCKEELEDYDEYMRKRLARVKQESFGFGRARQQVGGAVGGVSTPHVSSSRSDLDRRFSGIVVNGAPSERSVLDAAGRSGDMDGCGLVGQNMGMVESLATNEGNGHYSGGVASEPHNLCPSGRELGQENLVNCAITQEKAESVSTLNDPCQTTTDQVTDHLSSDAVKPINGLGSPLIKSKASSLLIPVPNSATSERSYSDVQGSDNMSISKSVKGVGDGEVKGVVFEGVESLSERVEGEVAREVEGGRVRRAEGEVVREMEDKGVRRVEGEVMREVEDEGVRRVEGEVVSEVEDEGIRRMEGEMMRKLEDDGVRRVEDEVTKLGDEGVRKVEGEVRELEDEGVRRAEDEVMMELGDEGVKRVEGEVVRELGGEGVRRVEDEVVRELEDEGVRGVEGEVIRGVEGAREVVNVVDVENSQDGQNIQNMLSSLVYSLGLNEMETKRIISLWHNRTIVPPLDPAHLSQELARRDHLYWKEHENFELQSRRARLNNDLSTKSEQFPTDKKGRSLRSGRTLPDPNQLLHEDLAESPSPGMESSEEESGTEAEVTWDMDNTFTDSSDISDWTAESGFNFRPRRKRLKRKRKSSESILSNDEEDDRVLSQSADEGSSGKGRSNGKKKKPRKRSFLQMTMDYSAYAPPDWLKQTIFQLSPYYPQVGDIVVYCHQGHKLYVDSVRDEKIYPLQKTKMPYQKYDLLPQEFCQVTNVRYLVGPPTLCLITLALLSPLNQSEEEMGGSYSKEGQKKRVTFTFKFHDMNSVLDFLVLESLYKISVCSRWEEGDRFRSLIDGRYWVGTVKEKKAFSEEHPNSYWQCYSVLWDDGATDLLSPWDMEPLQNGEEGEEEAPRIHELQIIQRKNLKDDWGSENEPDRILKGLELVSKMDEAFMFLNPVDLEQVSNYCMYVAFPTDLATIKERLQNGLYRRKRALLWELAQMAKNAVLFNEEDSLIVKHARVLVQTLWKFIESPEIIDPLDCYAPEPEGEVEAIDVGLSEEVVFVDTRDLPPPEQVIPIAPVKQINDASQRPSTSTCSSVSLLDGVSTGDKPIPVWVAKAKKLLQEMSELDSADPFLEPVDTIKFNDYLKFVKEPMDLGTVGRKLDSGEYLILQDFISDMRLIFQNSYLYNRKGSKMHKITTDIQSFLEKKISKEFEGESIHSYMTRHALSKLADTSVFIDRPTSSHSRESSMESSFNVEEEDNNIILRRSCRILHSRSNRTTYLSDNCKKDIESCSDAEESLTTGSSSVSSYNDSVAQKRQTRSMQKELLSSPVSDVSSVDKEDHSLTPRTRSGTRSGGRKRRKVRTAELDDSDEDDYSEKGGDKEEESVDGESEEYYVEKRRGHGKGKRIKEQRVPTTMNLRKRRRILSYSEDEEENDTRCTVTSRSGRVVKRTIKSYY